jgi:hypothetical protein
VGFLLPALHGQAEVFRMAAPGRPSGLKRSPVSVHREDAAALIPKWPRARFFLPNGKEKRMNFMPVILVLAILFFANTALADVPLSGTIGNITIDDTVEIRRNTSATLNGTVIKGNVLVRSGATLISNGAKIDGNVQAFGAYLVDLRPETKVDGDVQGEGTRFIIVRGVSRKNKNTVVGGNVQLTEASAAATEDALRVEFSQVDGDLQVEKSPGRLRALGNQIGGNLQFVENKTGTYEIENNSIGGDLQFFKNRGSGQITGNTVEGNLQSKENAPAPVVVGNTVRGDTEIDSSPPPPTPVKPAAHIPLLLLED